MTHEEQRLWLIRKLKAGNPGYSRIGKLQQKINM